MRLKWNWFVAAGVLVGGVGAVGHEERATSEYCQQCCSCRLRARTGIGPITLSRSDETFLSHVYRDLLDTEHKHKWALNCATRSFFGGEMIACGFDAAPNDFASTYDENPGFRDFVLSRIKSGKLDRAMAIRMIAAPRMDKNDRATTAGRALCTEFLGD